MKGIIQFLKNRRERLLRKKCLEHAVQVFKGSQCRGMVLREAQDYYDFINGKN